MFHNFRKKRISSYILELTYLSRNTLILYSAALFWNKVLWLAVCNLNISLPPQELLDMMSSPTIFFFSWPVLSCNWSWRYKETPIVQCGGQSSMAAGWFNNTAKWWGLGFDLLPPLRGLLAEWRMTLEEILNSNQYNKCPHYRVWGMQLATGPDYHLQTVKWRALPSKSTNYP